MGKWSSMAAASSYPGNHPEPSKRVSEAPEGDFRVVLAGCRGSGSEKIKRSQIPGEGPGLPDHPPTCSVCGKADWLVSLGTLSGGPSMHVECWKKEQKQ